MQNLLQHCRNLKFWGGIFPLLLLIQCHRPEAADQKTKQPSRTDFPAVQSLTRFPGTDFVPTMEEPGTAEKNIIYTPAFLYAWNEFRQVIHSDVKVLSDQAQLGFINRSVSWENTLEPSEIQKAVTLEQNLIIIQASFSKAMTFPEPFDTMRNSFRFRGQQVNAFGMPFFSDVQSSGITIFYYKDDDHFIVELAVTATEERLILAKGIYSGSLAEVYAAINKDIKIGNKDRFSSHSDWKYRLVPGDDMLIPELRFHLIADYSGITGGTVGNKLNDTFTVRKATQRTAFVFNETGAKVESEVMLEVEVPAEVGPPPPAEEKAQPKHLVFDKPFFIIMKRAKSSAPYFMMKVYNGELMVKS